MVQISAREASDPLHRYRQALANGTLEEDASQALVVDELQDLYNRVRSRELDHPHWFTRLLPVAGKHKPVAGLYIWGGVGRGKTCLMDMFFQSLDGISAMRVHFHRFMKRVHDDLNHLHDAPNPLKIVARRLAAEASVLCFDEFFVSDIGDAMLLAGLLEVLFEEGVVLVATSNIPPDRLYENGLQRQQFIPAIELIKIHTKVIHADGVTDYRLRNLSEADLYFTPADQLAEQNMQECYQRLAGGLVIRQGGDIDILGRSIHFVRECEGLVWFTFADICETPRSALDYIELARQYHTVLISGVPVFGDREDDAARRFIALIDEFYDRQVKLVLSAAASPQLLYTGKELAFAFERTGSRLQEMQTGDYLRREHRP